MFLIVFQRLLLETIFDFIYFPIWWYTKGMVHAAKWCFDLLKRGNQTLAPGLWLANIFVPMFGQNDWQGRIVSFFMRLVQVIFRGIALIFYLIFCVILFLLWLLLPVAVVYGLIAASALKGGPHNAL